MADTDTLPGVLDEIAQIVGTDGALLIAERFGGAELYIPKYQGCLRLSRNGRIREDINPAFR